MVSEIGVSLMASVSSLEPLVVMVGSFSVSPPCCTAGVHLGLLYTAVGISRVNILISKARSCSSHTASEAQHHFCCFPLLGNKHMVNPDPKGAEID